MAARGWLVATIPSCAKTGERPPDKAVFVVASGIIFWSEFEELLINLKAPKLI
jgi:hypothetical protein